MLSGHFPCDLIEALDIEQTNQVIDSPSICQVFVTRLAAGSALPNSLAYSTNSLKTPVHRITHKILLDYITEQKQWQLTSDHGVHHHSVVVVANGNEFETLAPTAACHLDKLKDK